MDFTPSTKRRRTAKPEVNPLRELYPHDLNTYRVPPKGDLLFVDFQNYAIERQKGMLQCFLPCYELNFDSNI